MKILKTLVLASSIFFFFSCESEQEILEQEQEINIKTPQNYQSKASSHIIRGKLKRRSLLSYRTTLFVDNSSEQVKSFALLLEGSGGSLETVIKPSGKKNAKGLEIYKWNIEEENLFKVGEEVKVFATPLNADGKEIGEPQVLTMTVEGNKQESTFAYIRRGKIKLGEVSSYTAKFFVDNSSEQVKSFALLLEGSGGSLETVIKPSGKKNAKGYEIYNWDFDGDGIFEKGEEAKVTATPLNANGEKIGEPQVLYLKIQADFTGKIKRVRIKKRRVGSGFKLKANIIDNNDQAVTAKIKIDNLKGYTTTINTEIKNNTIEVSFDSKNEEDKVFNITIILQDRQGQRVHKPFVYTAALDKSTPLM